ncbi:MAG: carboxypeptidase regulatory-like domain-containing protein [Candidatus Acidiferrales bacterium]
MCKRENRKLRLLAALLFYSVCLVSGHRAFGQATTGTIYGTVRDVRGGVIAGAAVAVRNLDTNLSRSLTTGEEGRFRFPGLPVGPYELTVEQSGFAKYVNGSLMLLLNQEAVVNPVLQVAGTTEKVIVSEDAPLLNTTSPEVGVRFDEWRLTDLPTLPPAGSFRAGFRDVFTFALAAPGVSQLNSGNQVFATGTNFSVNGARVRSNTFMIDGQASNNPGVTGRGQVMNNPEIVQEFRLITNQFLAEYGGAAGSVVSLVTKSGTNDFHGSAFWFHNDNALNACNNLDKRGGLTDPRFCSSLSSGREGAPFRIENQFGGTLGGPIWRNRTFFFGSVQRWTDRELGSGTSVSGVPTDAGKALLQSTVGSRPQVAAFLQFVPGAPTQGMHSSGNPTFAAYCVGGGTLPSCSGGPRVDIPTGTITGSAPSFFNDWQASGRVDHTFNSRHSMGGRYLFDDSEQGGGQATPSGLTIRGLNRTQAMSVFFTSSFTPRVLNESRISWQRRANATSAADPSSETIPSIEIPEMGLTGFAASASRTAIGLPINLPNGGSNNTYQLQETIAWTRGAHALKFGLDIRRVDIKSTFFPFIRGRLTYPSSQAGLGLAAGTVSIQNFVDDVAAVANINKPLPGGQTTRYFRWYDYFFFAQDSWQVHNPLFLSLGLRYEAPGNALASLYPVNDAIQAANGGDPVFRLEPRPGRDLNNFQPRFGFAWNPRTGDGRWLRFLTGGNQLVVRGGYARTNDYQFLTLANTVSTTFPFVVAVSSPGLANAFTALPTLNPDLSNPAALNLLNRTIQERGFRSPIAEQFSLEIQRELDPNTVFRVGYVGTKGTALFQTIDGNPRTLCSAVPIRIDNPTTGAFTVLGCPRVDPSAGVITVRANSASSIYHSMQLSLERRFHSGLSAGVHYTWSSFIDTASDLFNPSVRGEVALAQNSFNRRADRARSTYDRPHRFSVNAVYELPLYRSQAGAFGRLLGGWQIGGFLTLQSGTPFGALNGSDPTAALSGIDALVGDPIRPNLNTSLPLSSMTIKQLRQAGGNSLFSTLAPCTRISTTLTCVPGDRFGNVGRNILRADGIGNVDLSVSKTTRLFADRHKVQFRADFFNLTNTRNFGIPEARITNPGFLDEASTDGGNRRIFLALKYSF